MNSSRPWVRCALAALMVAGACAPALEADTHRFVPERFYNTFSFAHPPALRIKPGDRVVTRTIDAAGVDWDGKTRAQGPNPQTGPFFVEGAEPGDMLVVTHREDRDQPRDGVLVEPAGALCGRSGGHRYAAGSRAAPGELADRQGRGWRTLANRHPPGHHAAAAADARLRRRGAGPQGGDRHLHARRVRRQHGLRRPHRRREGDAAGVRARRAALHRRRACASG